ncbi:hypothetical protein [Sphingobium yanoikuyae]|uniref:hypothetical protein n=1 Tax=Sphingobium yanoikuyae TaxID=13690 RepID=UPI0022DE528C|nr:hypothetical protein [Sphingobium yanoikuyae]WBQ19472.1 hypothetical protein PAE53_23320 [Sphingobium yanoikuyae]
MLSIDYAGRKARSVELDLGLEYGRVDACWKSGWRARLIRGWHGGLYPSRKNETNRGQNPKFPWNRSVHFVRITLYDRNIGNACGLPLSP